MSFTPDKNSVPYAATGADRVPDLGFVVNKVNGRTYQRRQRAMLDEEGNEIFFDVWDTISDRKTTTYIGAEDPTKDDRDSSDAMQKFHAGDMWWDTADLELRVLHQPKLGTTTSAGEEIDVFGRKAWVSSTHPTAYMLGDNVGSNKNQNLGNCYLTGGFQEYLYSGDTLSAELSMPFYTGDDTLDSDVADVDKRYTVTYRAIPTHNGDGEHIASLRALIEGGDPDAEAELATYENIVVVDPDNFGLVDVTIGQIAPTNGVEKPHVLLIEATVEVKTAYIDEFITNTSDGVISAPQAVAQLVPIKMVYPRVNLPVSVPVKIEPRTFGEILADDGLIESSAPGSSGIEYPDTIDKDDVMDWVVFPDVVEALPEGSDDNPENYIEIYGHINNTGLGPEGGLEESDAPMWNQIPYNSTFVDTNRFGLIKLRFEYENEAALLENTLEFYLTGYRQNVLGINVPDVEDQSLYTTIKSTIESEEVNGVDVHYVSLMVDYEDLPPDGRYYMVVRNTNTGDLKHDLKGALYLNNRDPFLSSTENA